MQNLKLSFLFLFLLFVPLFTSCNNDEFQSSAEIAAAKFEKVAKENNVTNIDVYWWSNDQYYRIEEAVKFKVEGIFLVVGGLTETKRYYNFDNLDRFFVHTNRMEIYFR